MFDTFRKYGHVYIALIISIFMLVAFSDCHFDSQETATQVNTTMCANLLEDNADFDEDDEYLLFSDFEARVSNEIQDVPFVMHQSLLGRKCTKAMLLGQVRHHFPRNGIAEGHNYTFLPTNKSGVDVFHATFFVPFTRITTKFYIP